MMVPILFSQTFPIPDNYYDRTVDEKEEEWAKENLHYPERLNSFPKHLSLSQEDPIVFQKYSELTLKAGKTRCPYYMIVIVELEKLQGGSSDPTPFVIYDAVAFLNWKSKQGCESFTDPFKRRLVVKIHLFAARLFFKSSSPNKKHYTQSSFKKMRFTHINPSCLPQDMTQTDFANATITASNCDGVVEDQSKKNLLVVASRFRYFIAYDLREKQKRAVEAVTDLSRLTYVFQENASFLEKELEYWRWSSLKSKECQ